MQKFLNSTGSTSSSRAVAWMLSFITAAILSLQPVSGQTSQGKVNVNTADLSTLETLPGVGATTAQRIIDSRPYKSLSDLEKVKGLSKSKVEAMQDQITLGSTSSKSKTSKATNSTEHAASKSSSTATGGRVNVNTADLATLETLPGVGPTVAQRIIDGRPYSNITDLEAVKGLGKTKADALEDQVTFGSTSTKSKSSKSTSKQTTTGNGRAEPADNSTPLPATGRSSTGQSNSGETVNINTASAEQLDTLYGIGPTKAQAIIDYRNEHGRFQSIEDIMKVNGIKEGEFDKIKDNITVR